MRVGVGVGVRVGVGVGVPAEVGVADAVGVGVAAFVFNSAVSSAKSVQVPTQFVRLKITLVMLAPVWSRTPA